jgi:DNA mismatch repair protein MutL
MPIRQLPPEVAAQIAAGEVVERPASVVKELVENSLDAGATHVAVSIREGGVAEIRVTDDGSGIAAPEVDLAFRHHATSKLAIIEDLSTVATLGFRGEALPSIAAVTRLTITTRPADAESGIRAELRYGEPGGTVALGCPVGTTVQAMELFANLPARRRFLRSTSAESSRIQEVVTRYALASPQVRFTLHSDGRLLIDTPGSGRLQEVILALYGADVAARMLPVYLVDADVTVDGYTSAPELSRHNRSYMTLLINGRWVHDRSILFAVERAYQGSLPDRRYPLAVINLAIPPERVDINSHPTKREVRFRGESQLFSSVQRAVRDALLAHAPVRQVERSSALPSGPRTPSGVSPGVAGETGPRVQGADRALVNPSLSSISATQFVPLRQTLATLRVVGQIRQTYVVAEGDGGMYLIDQHAAHERVVYDRLRRQWANQERTSQPLLAPSPSELTHTQIDTLHDYRELMAASGFDVEPFGDNAWLLRAIPAQLATNGVDPARALMDLLDAVAVEQVVMEREEALAATIACHGSVRAGMTLSVEEMTGLLEQLEKTPEPHHCPHGRPTIVHFTEYQLEREFGRR